jgi:hypothetical protein
MHSWMSVVGYPLGRSLAWIQVIDIHKADILWLIPCLCPLRESHRHNSYYMCAMDSITIRPAVIHLYRISHRYRSTHWPALLGKHVMTKGKAYFNLISNGNLVSSYLYKRVYNKANSHIPNFNLYFDSVCCLHVLLFFLFVKHSVNQKFFVNVHCCRTT